MSIQAIFDNEALDQLEKVSKEIRNAEQKISDAMKSIALRQIEYSIVCLSDMMNAQKTIIDEAIIEIFKYKKLI